MMKKLTFFIFFYFLFIGICHATDAQDIIRAYSVENADDNFGYTINQMLQTAKFFDEKYPDNKINEDMVEDIQTFFPEMTQQQALDFQHNIREWLSFYRYVKGIYDEYKQKLLTPEEPPLIVDDDQYYDPSRETDYIQQDNNVVIFTDIKTIVPYSGNLKDIESANAKMIRDDSSADRKGDFDDLKYIVARTDLFQLPFYDVLYHSPLTGRKGIGSWQKKDDIRARVITIQTGIRDVNNILGVINVLLPKNKFIIANDGRYRKPFVSFERSDNLHNWNLSYPIPLRLNDEHYTDWTVYANELAIPVTFEVQDYKQPLVLRADITLYICDSNFYCQSEKFTPELTLKPEYPRKSAVSTFVEQQHYHIPLETHKKLTVNSVKIRNLPEVGDFIEAKLTAKTKISSLSVFIDSSDGIVFQAPRTTIDGKNITVRFLPEDLNIPLSEKAFEISANLNNHFFIRQAVLPKVDNHTDVYNPQSLIYILIMAFINSLLLYLSPFIFLILGIKIMSFNEYGARRPQNIRFNCRYTIIGILLSTITLCAGLATLKYYKIPIVWGTQLNNICFVVTMIYVLIPLIWYFNKSQSTNFLKFKKRISDTTYSKIKYLITGIMIVLMVSITNIPLLSNHLSYAFAGNTFELTSILLCTALGLATPFLIMNFFPQLIIFVPTPGTWLNLLKRIVNYAFCIAFISLISVVAVQTSISYAARLTLYVALAFFFLWIDSINRGLPYSEVDPDVRHKARLLISCFLTSLAIIIFVVSLLDGLKTNQHYHQKADTLLSDFNSHEISDFVKKGHTVLLNVGAGWCLTCRYNNLKLSSKTLTELFDKYNVRLINTGLNKDIQDLMKKYHRTGLPFNIIYSPLAPDGFVLPQIINEDEIKNLISNFTLNPPES